jgi:ribosomal protein L23
MNILLPIDQYANKHIYFSRPIKNMIINDSNFIGIIYSNNNIVLNYIFFHFNIFFSSIDKYFNKYKYTFDVNSTKNKEYIKQIIKIEFDILTKINILNKHPKYKMNEHIQSGIVKLFNENNNNINENTKLLIKISGIWENTTNYGIIYKFILA